MDLAELVTAELSYPDAGATRSMIFDGAAAPAGYHVVRHRRLIGRGPAAFAAAAELLRDWGLHRGTGFRVEATGPAEPGATVLARLGPGPLAVAAPCRVLWSVAEPDVAGFGYGTLPGHPEQGEEAFVVRTGRFPGAPGVVVDGRPADGSTVGAGADDVWCEILAFSRPAVWWVRAAGPAARAGQALAARRYAAVLARAAAGR